MNDTQYDLAIIGAGPAGMMAALRASECGARVVLLEKNSAPGAKLLMTGKERCNITNAETDEREFAAAFGKSGKFLLSALYKFGSADTIEFFHENNLPTKTERGGRIFPVSDKAKDVRDLLVRLMKQRGVKLMTGCRIDSIEHRDKEITGVVLDNDIEISAAAYLITTGGLSYPKTGSTGDGYRWAKRMGHTVTKPEPALTPLVMKEPWVQDLEGLSLKNVRISVYQKGKKLEDRFGEALFTGFGLSGPIILDMSKSIGQILKNGQTSISIDFKPALEHDKLDKRLLRDIEEFANKEIKNILPGLLPRKLIPVILDMWGVDPEKQGNSVTKDERKALRLLLKDFPMTVKNLLGFNKAVITAGGINLREIDPKTMRSKLIDNLFFAGEILDLDGPTGGYNLQVCWSTGYLAGEFSAKFSKNAANMK
ncbi:NAD(P)/FAD-dependent oxidoreductase [Candidatus Latescibacterota bacterium]